MLKIHIYNAVERAARMLLNVKLYHQPYQPFTLNEGIQLRHNHGIDLLIRHRRLIPTGIETTGVNLPSNLLDLHAMTGASQKVDNGFFKFHQASIVTIENASLNINYVFIPIFVSEYGLTI